MSRIKREDSADSLLNNGPRSEYVKKYPEHPLQKTKSYKPPVELTTGQGKVDSVTVQRRDYPEHPIQNTRPYKPDNTRGDLGRFDGNPSYREDYPEWKLPEKPPKGIMEWTPPQQPFEGKTTAMDDFPEHQVSPRVNHRPNMRPLNSEVPFAGKSDYHDTFKEHSLPPKHRREKQEWQKPVDPFDSATTQQKDFTGVYAPKQKSMRPDQAPISSGAPLEGDTTNSMSYRPHELPKRYRHEPEKYRQPEGPMDLHTTSSTFYKEHPLHNATATKPGSSNLLRGSGEMEKDSNYVTDYREHALGKRQLIKAPNDYVPPIVPLDSVTVNQTDYHPHKLGPRQNFRPKDAPVQSDQPFDDRTGYMDTFTEHKITPRQQRVKEVYTGPKTPMDIRTTVGDSYLGPYQPKRESCRPDRNAVRSDVPFDDGTTMNRDFKAYDVKRREMISQSEYQKPTGDMNLDTTHNTSYKEFPLHRQTYEKPGSSHLLRGHGEMSSYTNYQGDYIERPIEKRKLLKPDGEYRPPVDPMDSRTTHQSEFFEKQIGKRETFQPSNEPLRSDVPFEDRTENRDTFVSHKISPREIRQKEVHQAPIVPLDDRTTVKDSYKGPYQPQRESFKPYQNLLKSDVPFESDTTMNQAFKEYKIPPRFVHKSETYQSPDGPMDMATTHGTNYREHVLQRQTVTKPGSSHLLRGHGEMSKSTNYQNHFQEPPPMKRELARRQDQYQSPTVPIDSTTTTQVSYKEHELSPRTNYKPENGYIKSKAPFDDRTDYRERFTQHQVQPRQLRQREEHKPPTEPLESRTTAHDSFQGPYQPKRESFRPDMEHVKSDIPFNGDTTCGSTYKPWPTNQRFRHKPDPYVKPDGYMDLMTVNRESFKEVNGERPAMVKQGDSGILAGSGNFQDNTSYSKDFVPKSVENRKLVRQDNQYVPSSLPFENNTTYRNSHVGYVAPKERSRKPDALSDVLGQRDHSNPFRIQHDWRDMLTLPKTETVSA